MVLSVKMKVILNGDIFPYPWVDPLFCSHCGSPMKIISFIYDCG